MNGRGRGKAKNGENAGGKERPEGVGKFQVEKLGYGRLPAD